MFLFLSIINYKGNILNIFLFIFILILTMVPCKYGAVRIVQCEYGAIVLLYSMQWKLLWCVVWHENWRGVYCVMVIIFLV